MACSADEEGLGRRGRRDVDHVRAVDAGKLLGDGPAFGVYIEPQRWRDPCRQAPRSCPRGDRREVLVFNVAGQPLELGMTLGEASCELDDVFPRTRRDFEDLAREREAR